MADHGRRQHPDAASIEGEVKTKGGPKVKGASLTPELGETRRSSTPRTPATTCACPDTFVPGSLTGKIVLCRRGAIGRAAKGADVAAAGGVGMVLYNNDDDDNLFTDTHVVPAVHIDYTDGLKLKNYIDKQAARARTPRPRSRRPARRPRPRVRPR